MLSTLIHTYSRFILQQPKLICGLVAFITLLFATQIVNFRLDASGDTLVLENDTALNFYREIKKRYGSDDFLIMTYTPDKPLFDDSSLKTLEDLSLDLTKVPGLESIISILNVPLIDSPPVTLLSLKDHIPTLLSNSTDKVRAKQELITSPLYKNLLISGNADTTAILLYIKPDAEFLKLQKQRAQLKDTAETTPLVEQELKKLNKKYSKYLKTSQKLQGELISNVRKVMKSYSNQGTLHLGGVPMITADSISFIHHDLINFGLVVVLFIIVTLAIAFSRLRWVVLPLLCCIVSGIVMVGFLGFADWPVTVVSSNFISLMLILTLSLTIHLIVRYQELHWGSPDATQLELVSETIKKKFVPCLFTTATTVVAFGSLIISDIRPVIDFGWMMTIGVLIAFVMAFTLFPASLMLLPPGKVVDQKNLTERLTLSVANTLIPAQIPVLIIYIVIITLSIIGLNHLTVENRFIDYFKESTEIHQGMALIDKKLGGTTPLDIIINAPSTPKNAEAVSQEEGNEDDFLEEFGLESDELTVLEQDKPSGITASYWFNTTMLKRVSQYHEYLDSLPQTGKVLSIASGMRLINQLDPDTKTENFKLSLVHKKLPATVKSVLFDPYLSEDGNQLRFSIRVFESDKSLKRDALLQTIKTGLTTQFNLQPEQIKFTGMLVLYNNMLKSLFNSQILTLGAVFFSILMMFILLYRNILLSLITLVPNLVAAAMVLSIMGWLSIPLDMMTITIAAICVGIAVDNSIHYVHRFKVEYKSCGNYKKAMLQSHSSIGRAMYYTSITITLGFSILILSNFMPSIYFGLLTGFAMLVALIANLTLLPLLLVKLKPL